jgi:hypothetical protein
MRKFVVPVVALAGALAAAGAFAQGTQPQQGGMMQMMPMQQGQQGGMMIGCPMMQRMASMDERLHRLEERAGVPAPQPPAQPGPGAR